MSSRCCCTVSMSTFVSGESSFTWRTVASTSAVSVFVIDWTTIGWSEPTGTPPTRTVAEGRRSGVDIELMVERATAIGTRRARAAT